MILTIPHFIAFFGPDGSGKSTQVDLLVAFLKSKKVKVKKIWIRSPHTIAYILMIFLLKMGYYRIIPNLSGKQLKLPAVCTSRGMRSFWSAVETAGVLPLVLLRVYMPLLLGYTIVAERYLVDTVVTIAYYVNDISFVQSRAAKFLLNFMPKDILLIHLDSDYSTIARRRGSKTEPADFIEFQRTGYMIIGNLVGAKLIDTSKSSSERTLAQIKDLLEISPD